MYRLKRLVQVFSILSWILILTACGLGDSALPTLIPRVNLGSGRESGGVPESEATIDESPRTGLEVEIPATWTPESESELPAPLDQPTPSTSSETRGETSPTRTYIVQQGDTLAEIAIKFEVTLEELARANSITDVDRIEAGQELIIPGTKE